MSYHYHLTPFLLGSVDTITNSQGEVVERSLYKPFGEHLRLYTKPDSRSITNRGYTGHEEIEGTSLVHMNARVYDPTLGRFMSADTLIQDPYDMQTYNRYSYVRNNPLKYTDPSGHSFLSIIKAVLVAIVTIAVTVAILGTGNVALLGYFGALQHATVATLIQIGAIAGFAGSYTNAILSGASPGQALVAGLQGAVIGAITAGLTNKIAGVLGHTGNYLQRAIAHGIVSGVMRVVQGGNFGNGFMSTFFSTIAGGIQVGTKWVQGVFQTLVGGTASLISGGKFANGAVSAAMVFMFNDAMAADYAAKKLNTALGNIETKHVQNASSYQEVVDSRAKIDALFVNGANVVMVVSGAGEMLMLTKAAWQMGGKELLSQAWMLSKNFGVGSKYFGNSFVRQGELNIKKSFFKIGWSGTDKYGGGSYFRIGIGRSSSNPAHAFFHFKVPGSFVPDNIANAIRAYLKNQ